MNGGLGYIFCMGVLSSLTPCVYPLIPITVSLFGITPEMGRLRAFVLSSSYVAGMASMYTLLGMISAKTGLLFGSLLGHPLVVITVSLLLIVLALHSLELFELPLSKLQNRAGSIGGKGMGGAFLLGIASGAVAAPCVGPVLVAILLEAARAPSVWWGSLQLFVYALGMGMLFLLLGTFSGLLSKLPRSGNWLTVVKYVIAVALLVMVLSYCSQLAGDKIAELRTPLILSLLSLGTLLLLFFATRGEGRKFRGIRALSAACAALLLSIGTSTAAHQSPGNEQPQAFASSEWFESLPEALEAARVRGKPLMVDLYAKWCAACKELAHTFEDSRVSQSLAQDLVLARIDLTTESEQSEALQQNYGIVGLPSVLFINSQGEELKDLRITGAMTPVEFLKHLAELKKRLGVDTGFRKISWKGETK